MGAKQKAYALSIIIPVYNEEDYLADCLDSIAEQTVKPLEVIVVDNNSTDATPRIAKKYDFVRLVREKRQHQSYAQHTGFGLARGGIIGRIDADTILPEDWVERVLSHFENEPDTAVAINGSGKAYDVSFPEAGQFIFNTYFRLSSFFAGHPLMWGSNCAFRRSAWPSIKDKLLLRDDIWEDYDLSFCLAEQGRIKNMKDIDVQISYRSIHKSPIRTLKYEFRSVRTFSFRRSGLVTAMFGLAWSSVLLAGPLIFADYYIFRPISSIPRVRMFLDRLAYLVTGD